MKDGQTVTSGHSKQRQRWSTFQSGPDRKWRKSQTWRKMALDTGIFIPVSGLAIYLATRLSVNALGRDRTPASRRGTSFPLPLWRIPSAWTKALGILYVLVYTLLLLYDAERSRSTRTLGGWTGASRITSLAACLPGEMTTPQLPSTRTPLRYHVTKKKEERGNRGI